MTKAIVTVVIGEPYTAFWQTKALPTWQRYAQKHGYQVLAFQRLLDESPDARRRSVAWQKLLVLSHPQVQSYDRVLWLDADIIINDAAAPCAFEQTPPELVGAVRDQSLLSHPMLASAYARVNTWQDGPVSMARYFYEKNQLAVPADYFLNTGVLVLSPLHRDLMREIYCKYPQNAASFYEQIGLSYEIISRKLHHPLDPRFNLLWLEYQAVMSPFSHWGNANKTVCIAAALNSCFFLHFAAALPHMELFDPLVGVVKEGMTMPLKVLRRLVEEYTEMADKWTAAALQSAPASAPAAPDAATPGAPSPDGTRP